MSEDIIIGYTGFTEVFALKGLHRDKNIYEIRDDKGNVIEPDLSEVDQLKIKVDKLEKDVEKIKEEKEEP